jgi:cell division transport system ATP-binding protein
MISFEQVTKKYGDVVALEDITFNVGEGEFIFITGPSGAGKSTIIRLLIREELPTLGSIKFAGFDVVKLKKSGLPHLRREIGVVFQDFKLLTSRTVFENVAFAMEAAGKPKKEIEKSVNYMLELVDLSAKAKSFPHQLSGGEKQRTAIARAMINDPQVLIADEPTGNLDPSMQWDIIQLLNKINNWGTTVIMATHASDVVNSLQKRVVTIENGKMVRDSKGGYVE